MNFLQYRLADIDSFPFFYESIALKSEDVKNIYDVVSHVQSTSSPINAVDISFMERDSIVFLLQSFDANNSDVYILWCSNNVGIKIPYHFFCKFYDDLWYPSSDDVWVYDTQNKFCLEISHEEIVMFWRPFHEGVHIFYPGGQ